MRKAGWRGAVAWAVPATDWLPQWRSLFKRDAVAALAVWAVLVPQSMAYATLAGVPPVYGLYAAVAGLVVYGLLGTSRVLNVGPSSGAGRDGRGDGGAARRRRRRGVSRALGGTRSRHRPHSPGGRACEARLRRRVPRAPGARRLLHRARADHHRRAGCPRCSAFPAGAGGVLREAPGYRPRRSRRELADGRRRRLLARSRSRVCSGSRHALPAR